MGTLYVGLSLENWYFNPKQNDQGVVLHRSATTPEHVRAIVRSQGCVSLLNSYRHAALIEALQRRFGIDLPVQHFTPCGIKLQRGDDFIEIHHTLPDLGEREVYSDPEINLSTFEFSWYYLPHEGEEANL